MLALKFIVGGIFLDEKGVLYICPTPIGNLEDITLRTLKVLREVDIIAAEDTRVTRKLLNHYEIKTPLMSYHEHNKREKGPEIILMLQEGKDVALVTDAGTPGLSDPGEDLVRLSVDGGIRVVPLPGAAAAICALVASGLSAERFVFEGFLPRKKKERSKRLKELSGESRTLILYEAPHRLLKTLEDLRQVLGDRRIAVAREMTKIHEEFFRGTLSGAIDRFTKTPPKGELVLVLEGQPEIDGPKYDINAGEINPLQSKKIKEGFLSVDEERDASEGDTDFKELLKKKYEYYTSIGFSRKKALKRAAEELGISRNKAYSMLLEKTEDLF